jgi:5-formyltetrahydrofolate cyclo-ligase
VEKTELRTRLRAARAARSAGERTGAARSLRDTGLDLPQVQMAGTIAAYHSVGNEPGTHSLLYALWKRGTYVILPILLADGDLDWASFEGPDSLIPGPRFPTGGSRPPGSPRLMEPGEPPRGPAAIARADVVLVPALAVDRAGNRLGRGGGSYDRALARVSRQIPTIALLYDDELLDELPTAPHDRPVSHAARPATGITLLPCAVESPGGAGG